MYTVIIPTIILLGFVLTSTVFSGADVGGKELDPAEKGKQRTSRGTATELKAG